MLYVGADAALIWKPSSATLPGPRAALPVSEGCCEGGGGGASNETRISAAPSRSRSARARGERQSLAPPFGGQSEGSAALPGSALPGVTATQPLARAAGQRGGAPVPLII
jgi:hypothetical protein